MTLRAEDKAGAGRAPDGGRPDAPCRAAEETLAGVTVAG